LQKTLKKALAKPKFLFTTGQNDTWLSIRNDLRKKIDDALSNFKTSTAGLVLEMKDVEEIKQSLRDYAINVVKRKARNEAEDVVKHMKNR
jgi:low affinity Fe/Cu permease